MGPRRRGLRIAHFRLPPKAHPLRRSSSSAQTRFAGLWPDPGTLGGGYRTRTGDPLLAKQVLYQLS